MSWLTSRDAQNASNYRYIRFVGGRILQDKELNALQDSDALRDKYGLGAIFREGATANVRVTIDGSNVVLAKANAAYPVMLAFFNGAFEPLAEQTIALPAPKASGTDTLYLHWVLWRVTSDGKYEGRDGCLADAALIDQQTSEQVAERGQLQVVLSFDQTLSAEAVDTDRMIAKSSAAVPLFKFTWAGSVAAYTPEDDVNAHMLATPSKAGMVTVTSGTGAAVGADDARLTDSRMPSDASVRTSKVAPTEAVAGQVTSINSQEVKVGPTDGGIDADRLFWSGIKARVSDTLNYFLTKITELLSAKTNHESRITALEQAPDKEVDLSFHVGKKLGRFADGGFSHEPIVEDDKDGFRHYSALTAVQGQVADYSPYYAFATHRKKDGTRLGGIRHDGDYELANPLLASMIAAANGGQTLNSFYKLAIKVGTLSGGVGGGGTPVEHLNLAGDVNGDNTANTVGKIQNVPVDKYRSDHTDAKNGDVLTYQNGTWRPAAQTGAGGTVDELQGDVTGAPNATAVAKIAGKPVDLAALAGGQFLGFDGTSIKGMTAPGAPSLDTPSGALPKPSPTDEAYSIAYTIVNFGTYKLAFGSGLLRSGAVIPFPEATWNKSWSLVSASPAKRPAGSEAYEVVQPSQANGWTVSVQVNGAAPADPAAWLLAVNVVTITPVV
jgi:hypothetical protein